MKKVLVFLADGFEEIEALSVVDVLRRASLKCDLCSIKDEFVRGIRCYSFTRGTAGS